MQTNGTTDVLPLGKKQKYASNIVMGALLFAAGLILILSGVGVIDAPIGDIAAPTVLFAIGTGMLVAAIIGKNSLTMWIAGVVLACGLVSLLEAVTPAGYENLYPIYIAAPGVGCVFSIWYAEAKLPQVKTMLFFAAVAAAFSLNSSGACGWGIAGGVLAAVVGVCIIIFAVNSYLDRGKENA